MQTFYNGLLPDTQTMVDVVSGGALVNKTLDEAYELIKVMASNNYMKPTNRSTQRKIAGIHDIDFFNNYRSCCFK